jgi:hypothetical protein
MVAVVDLLRAALAAWIECNDPMVHGKVIHLGLPDLGGHGPARYEYNEGTGACLDVMQAGSVRRSKLVACGIRLGLRRSEESDSEHSDNERFAESCGHETPPERVPARRLVLHTCGGLLLDPIE